MSKACEIDLEERHLGPPSKLDPSIQKNDKWMLIRVARQKTVRRGLGSRNLIGLLMSCSYFTIGYSVFDILRFVFNRNDR